MKRKDLSFYSHSRKSSSLQHSKKKVQPKKIKRRSTITSLSQAQQIQSKLIQRHQWWRKKRIKILKQTFLDNIRMYNSIQQQKSFYNFKQSVSNIRIGQQSRIARKRNKSILCQENNNLKINRKLKSCTQLRKDIFLSCQNTYHQKFSELNYKQSIQNRNNSEADKMFQNVQQKNMKLFNHQHQIKIKSKMQIIKKNRTIIFNTIRN